MYVSTLRRQKRKYLGGLASQLDALHGAQPREFWKLFANRSPQGPAVVSPLEWAAYFEGLLNAAAAGHQLPDGSEVCRYFYLSSKAEQSGVPEEALEAPLSCEEVSEALKTLKNGKAAGVDGMPVEVYKCVLQKLLPFFTRVFNTLFELGVFPPEWAVSVITAIFKSGDPRVLSNYRGVSVITVLSKWYARVLDLRVSPWAESSGRRVRTQAGFRKGYSTYDKLLILQSVLNKYAHRKQEVFHRVYVGFIDFRKAYDPVIWERLWLRL